MVIELQTEAESGYFVKNTGVCKIKFDNNLQF